MKLKEKTKKRIRGSISVLLVIILLPMMTFSALIVDMSRINMAKQMMSSAGDLTMNTALANYDTILKDVYGLFAMSQANNLTDDELGQELENYFARTLTAYGVVPAEDSNDYVKALIGDFTEIVAGTAKVDTTDFLEMDLAGIDVTAQRVPDSDLANASVLRKQIVEYMKYRAPLSFGLSFLDSLTAFEKVDDQNDVVEAQVTAQESTQDVTQACAKLIKMIREYDKLVVELDKEIKGKANSSDNVNIPLADYDTHVEQYLSGWGENYTHINKLNLVFLVNSPSISNAYLKSLGYGAGKYFVQTGGTGLVYDSNISVSLELGGDKDASKTQVYDQITTLNGQYLTYANNYEVLLPSTNLVSSFISKAYFANNKEAAAIDAFIAFEKFFLNEADSGDVTYDQVKATLEQVTALGKYYDNYKTQIDAAIAQAEQDVATAQGKVNTETANRDNASGNMQTQVSNINWTVDNYASGYESLDDALAFLNLLTDDQQTNIRNLLQTLTVPTGDYGTYYTVNFTSPPTDRYHHYLNWLSLASNFVTNGTAMEKSICTWTQNFLHEGGSSYYDYMVDNLGEEVLNEDLFKLLKCLNTCSYYTDIYDNNIAPYNNAVAALAEAEAELAEAESVLEDLELERETVTTDYNSCLAQFRTLSTRYQADLYHYGYYIEAAKNTIADEAEPIKTQFSGIISNLDELQKKLEAISDQIEVVQQAINTYNENLKKWEQANKDYKDENGGDSFSGQTDDDIAKAKTEYNPDLYDTLDLFVINLWDEFDELYSKLTETTNFVYGSKRIDQITGAQDLIDAAAGVKASLPKVVTVEDANGKLSALYKAESLEYVPYTMDYTDPPQLTFLDPQVLQIQALKYLNSAYADESKLSDTQKAENAAKEQEYEDSKAQLTGKADSSDSGSGSGSTSESAKGDYGYTFDNEGKISSTEDFPSHNKDSKKEVSEDEYQLKEEGEGEDAKLNASDSVGAQSSKLDTVFQGIGNVATTALENLYVLNYIFENFSYNTIVQEQVIEDVPFTSNAVILQMGEYSSNATAENIKAAKEKITTFSNYTINEYNNHLFGGEVEYILFGNADPAKNVTYAKASIYGIRFVFNCIFAFTDSEIRNTTMAAGLAVQAATLGFVPYQLVQIVLQLALAAAESAIDLSAMCDGISVAIVKTKDTWSLSISSAKNVLVDAAKMTVTNALTDFANTAITGIANGLNDILEATADELNGAIYDLGENLEGAAKGVLEGVVDSAVSSLTSQIEEGLNSLLYMEGSGAAAEGMDKLPTKDEVLAQTTTLFQGIRDKLNITLTSACGGNEMALTMMDSLTEKANELINNVETEVINTINSVPTGEDITAHLTGQMDSLKLYLIDQSNMFISNLSTKITSAATGLVDQYSDKLQGYISDTAGELSEEAAQAIKDEVSAFADEFVGKLQVETGSSGTGGTGGTNGKASLASMFKFGYKDYLMVLTYISICTGDSVLLRTADVIQMNLQNAGTNAEFSHNAGNGFQMSNAYTYISITAETELDMFFMDLDLFKDYVTEVDPATGQPVPSQNTASELVYKGLLGY